MTEADAQDDWDTHWTSYADSASRNPAQRYRRRLVVNQLRRCEQPLRVVDVGSGQGDLAAELVQAFPDASVLGLERSRVGVELASAKVPNGTFHQADLVDGPPLPDRWHGWATAVVCSEVLEHVDRPEAMLRAIVPVFGPSAPLIVTVPGGPRSAYDVHIGHRRHYTRETLGRLLSDAGYRDVRVWAAGWPFFNLYKLGVIGLGKRLIETAARPADEETSSLRAASAGFNVLFRLNSTRTPWGWQLIATARP